MILTWVEYVSKWKPTVWQKGNVILYWWRISLITIQHTYWSYIWIFPCFHFYTIELIIILERKIDEFEAEIAAVGAGAAGNPVSGKPMKEFSSVQLLDIWEGRTVHVYLIAGKKDVFLLGEDEIEWAKRLTEEEMLEQLPMNIYWTGPTTNFEVSSKKTTEESKLTFIGTNQVLKR